jgi:DNA-binding beta-propeller fold protein YncE
MMGLDRCRRAAALLAVAMLGATQVLRAAERAELPTGQAVTPTAAPGSSMVALNPGLARYPDFTADGAVSLALSPDRTTLLVLTSGYDSNGPSYYKPDPAASNQYVFVFDATAPVAALRQVIPIHNTYSGIAFAPDGTRFYVSGGGDDDVHVYALTAGSWREAPGSPIALGHGGLANGVLQIDGAPASEKFPDLAPYVQGPLAAGLAVTRDGRRLVVANQYNDSITIVDLQARAVAAEVDLRPGKSGGVSGTPGGEYPYWVQIVGNDTAYVSSVRDREVVLVDLAAPRPQVKRRIAVPGAPNKMILNRAQTLLYVACDLQDVVAVIDTRRQRLLTTFPTVAPPGVLGPPNYHGASPDALALSADERTLYVTDRGTNAVAVIDVSALTPGAASGTRSGIVRGLIPTGWNPQDVVLGGSADTLYVINARSPAGPNPGNCYGLVSACLAAAAAGKTLVPDTYVLNLQKAGLQTLPLPAPATLAGLTVQVVHNNGWDAAPAAPDRQLMRALRARIRHVIYIVKENRTYDQMLGDLGEGNGDPRLAEFPRAITPNQHLLAREFVDLDNFYVSGDVSGDGWQWSITGRETDIAAKNVPMNYSEAERGGSYDWQGVNRFINMGLSGAARREANPATPADPDLLPGTRNVAAADGPEADEIEQGYLWNAALRARLSVRNYGFETDDTMYHPAWGKLAIPPERWPAREHVRVAYAGHPELQPLTDPYFRGFDTNYPDFYREAEWEREFAGYERRGGLPALSLVYLMMDHTSGGAAGGLDGVDTPETQVADNDYAVGRLVEAVSRSRYARDTLIFILEDDAQDGPDHVDAHRSIAFVIGPYVKHAAVVSTRYTTLSLMRTITDVLGLEHLGVFDAHTGPMARVFDLGQEHWSFTAVVPDVLRSTRLPLPAAAAGTHVAYPSHPASWWAQRTRGMDFAHRDSADAAAYNRILWQGLMGEAPYPLTRSAAAPVPVRASDPDD